MNGKEKRGSVYWDASTKGRKGRRHNVFRAETAVDGRRRRRRGKSREELLERLEKLTGMNRGKEK